MQSILVALLLAAAAVAALLLVRAFASRGVPARITLDAGPAPFRNALAVDALVKPLLREGFRDLGTFRIRETKRALRAFAHLGENAFAVVFDGDATRPARLELVTYYEDGTSATWATASGEVEAEDRRPGHTRVTVPGAGAAILWSRFLDGRSRRTMRSVAPREFRALFEAGWADEQAWRALREAAGAAPAPPPKKAKSATLLDIDVVRQELGARKSDVWGVDPR